MQTMPPGAGQEFPSTYNLRRSQGLPNVRFCALSRVSSCAVSRLTLLMRTTSPRRPFSLPGLRRGPSGVTERASGCSPSPGARRRAATADGFELPSATRPIMSFFRTMRRKKRPPTTGSRFARPSFRWRWISEQRSCCAWGVGIPTRKQLKCLLFRWELSNHMCCVAARSCVAFWETGHE